jgi:hypothetical protein
VNKKFKILFYILISSLFIGVNSSYAEDRTNLNNNWFTVFPDKEIANIGVVATSDTVSPDNILGVGDKLFFAIYYDYSEDKWYINQNGTKVECDPTSVGHIDGYLPLGTEAQISGPCASGPIKLASPNSILCMQFHHSGADFTWGDGASTPQGHAGTLFLSSVICSSNDPTCSAGAVPLSGTYRPSAESGDDAQSVKGGSCGKGLSTVPGDDRINTLSTNQYFSIRRSSDWTTNPASRNVRTFLNIGGEARDFVFIIWITGQRDNPDHM